MLEKTVNILANAKVELPVWHDHTSDELARANSSGTVTMDLATFVCIDAASVSRHVKHAFYVILSQYATNLQLASKEFADQNIQAAAYHARLAQELVGTYVWTMEAKVTPLLNSLLKNDRMDMKPFEEKLVEIIKEIYLMVLKSQIDWNKMLSEGNLQSYTKPENTINVGVTKENSGKKAESLCILKADSPWKRYYQFLCEFMHPSIALRLISSAENADIQRFGLNYRENTYQTGLKPPPLPVAMYLFNIINELQTIEEPLHTLAENYSQHLQKVGQRYFSTLLDLKPEIRQHLLDNNPYEPCPCDSGDKLRFCCAKR